MTRPNDSAHDSRTFFDSSNPLFLTSSDHPGMLLIAKPFDGSNFGSWSKSIAIALSAKNKLSFVQGKVPKPSLDDPMMSIWQRCNDMITSWILNALSPEIAESVLYSENANQIWEELNDRYGQASGTKLYQLHKEIISVEQEDNDITGYYAKFKKTWDEFTHLRNFPPCTCNCLTAMRKFEEDQKLIQFLMGLNLEYNTVRGSLLLMKPLPNLNQAYALLIQDEKQREIKNSGHFTSEHAALIARNSYSEPRSEHKNNSEYKGKNDSKKLICNYCKKPGHIAAKCYRLVGFPKDFKFTKGKKVAAGVSGISDDKRCQSEGNTSASGSSDGVNLSSEEYNQIIHLLNKSQRYGNNKDFLDSQNSSPYANFAGPFNKQASGDW